MVWLISLHFFGLTECSVSESSDAVNPVISLEIEPMSQQCAGPAAHNGKRLPRRRTASVDAVTDRHEKQGRRKSSSVLPGRERKMLRYRRSQELPSALSHTEDHHQSGKHKCFVCGVSDINTRLCAVTKCQQFYHISCVQRLPLTQINGGGSRFSCPLHACATCAADDSSSPVVRQGRMSTCVCVVPHCLSLGWILHCRREPAAGH